MYLYLSKNYNFLSQKLFKSSAYVFSMTALLSIWFSFLLLGIRETTSQSTTVTSYFSEKIFSSVEVRKRPQDILQFPAFLVKGELKRSILHQRGNNVEKWQAFAAFSNDLYSRKEKENMKKTSWELKCARKCIKEDKGKRKPII